MPITEPVPCSEHASGIAVCHLELSQGSLDMERVLGVLRTRGYRIDRLVLRGLECHIWIMARVDEVRLLHSRLERLIGVHVCSEVEWRA
jgi:acetolactate synthase regulatory subunit